MWGEIQLMSSKRHNAQLFRFWGEKRPAHNSFLRMTLHVSNQRTVGVSTSVCFKEKTMFSWRWVSEIHFLFLQFSYKYYMNLIITWMQSNLTNRSCMMCANVPWLWSRAELKWVHAHLCLSLLYCDATCRLTGKFVRSLEIPCWI